MKILLTGTIQSFADKKGTAVLEAKRRSKEGPVTETFYLKFHSDDAYREFKGRYALGAGVQVIGLLRQVQAPIMDRATKKPIMGSSGRELRNALLSVEVREHKPHQRGDELDTIYVHGMVGVVDKKELRTSASGTPWIQMRVAYNHFKRPGEEEGQGDFYNLVAFNGQAESLSNLERGDRFIVDYGHVSLDEYEMRDVTHSDGTPIMRNGMEIMLREFSYLPRSRQSGPLPISSGEEIPF